KALLQQQQQSEQKPQEAAKARKRRAGVPVDRTPVSTVPLVQEVHIHTDPKPLVNSFYAYASGYFHVLVMAGFVPFLVYFMLSWRDHISRTFLRLFQGDTRYVAGKSWLGISEATRAYVLGNFFLWIFLSSLSAIT